MMMPLRDAIRPIIAMTMNTMLIVLAFAEEVVDYVCDRRRFLEALWAGRREGGHEHEHAADEQRERCRR